MVEDGWSFPGSGDLVPRGIGAVMNANDPDIVLLRGSEIVLLDAHARHDLKRPIQNFPVNDVCVLPGSGASPGTDGLLVTRSTGLVHLFSTDHGTDVIDQAILDPSWSGVSMLRVDQGNRIYGYDPSLAAIRTAALVNGFYQAGPSIILQDVSSSDAAVLDFHPIDWVGNDGVDELVIQTTNNVRIHDPATEHVTILGPTYGAEDLLAVSRDKSGLDRVIQYVELLGTLGFLLVSDSSEGTYQPLYLGGHLAAHLTCFDAYHGDGKQDLGVSRKGSRDVVLFEYDVEGALPFGFMPTEMPSLVSLGSGVVSSYFIGGDVDGDGDEDMIATLPDRGEVVVERCGRFDETRVDPFYTAAEFEIDLSVPGGRFRTPSVNVSPLMSHLEVEIYAQTAIGEVAHLVTSCDLYPGNPYEVSLECALAPPSASNIYRIQAREAGPGGRKKGPVITIFFAEDPTVEDDLDDLPFIRRKGGEEADGPGLSGGYNLGGSGQTGGQEYWPTFVIPRP